MELWDSSKKNHFVLFCYDFLLANIKYLHFVQKSKKRRKLIKELFTLVHLNSSCHLLLSCVHVFQIHKKLKFDKSFRIVIKAFMKTVSCRLVMLYRLQELFELFKALTWCSQFTAFSRFIYELKSSYIINGSLLTFRMLWERHRNC